MRTRKNPFASLANVRGQTPPTLAYGVRAKRRLPYALVVACLLGLGIWLYGRKMIQKSELYLVERECARYTDASDAPVYAVIHEDEFASFLDRYPQLHDLGSKLVMQRAGRIAPAWIRYRAMISKRPHFMPQATIFLGTLTSTHCQRLVAITASADQYPETGSDVSGDWWGLPGLERRLALEIASVEQGGLLKSPTPRWRIVITNLDNVTRTGSGFPTSADNWVIYPGRVDPSALHTFRAKVTYQGEDGNLVGTLLEDGNVEISLEGFERRKAELGPDHSFKWHTTY